MAVPVTLLQLKTYDDLNALPDDGNRYELIFGEIVMSPSPRTKHQLALAALFMQLKRFVDERQLGEVLFAPLDVKFSEYSVVQPDILFVGRESLSRLGEQFLDGAPDIAIEALSPSNRMQDLVRKAALYINYGVPEYWVIDPDKETIMINLLTDGQYLATPVTQGSAHSRVLPGFAIDVAAVFTVPDWKKQVTSETE